MKLLAFVDLHGSTKILSKIAALAKKEKPDFLICAGDLTIFGDAMKQLVTAVDRIGIPTIMLHGNHEDREALKAACNKTKNVRFMHKETLESGDYVFMCYGGGGFSTVDTAFENWINKAMTKIPEGKKIILVTHAPPYGTKLDPVFDQSAGCKSIRSFIKKVQPKLAIAGHLHENAGVIDKIDKTKLVNPGPWGMILEV